MSHDYKLPSNFTGNPRKEQKLDSEEGRVLGISSLLSKGKDSDQAFVAIITCAWLLCFWIFSSTMLCLCETVICDMRQKKKKASQGQKCISDSQTPPWALVLLTTEHKGICLRKKCECFQSLATNDLYLETIPDKQSLQLVFHECHRSGSLI